MIADGNEGTAGIVSAGETPLIPIEEGAEEGSEVMPRDITFGGPTWCTLKTAATVYYAPYGTGCAPTEYTLPAGRGVYLVSRDYDYFYVYWYVDNKEMYGYIAMSALNLPSSYVWTEYDVYRPGRCTATTTVLSYAGTANSYHVIGEIYADEDPLMILGRQINPYNNVSYYFVQYQTTSGLIKRGWVDASLGTVRIVAGSTCENLYSSGPYCFMNRATGKAITWDRATNTLVQKKADGRMEQFFLFEKVSNVQGTSDYGFVRILSASDPTMAFTVEEKGYAEGLRIKMVEKAPIDKKQEFLVTFSYDTISAIYFKLLTRSTGGYRGVEVYGGSAAENTKIIQSKYLGNLNQQWEILRVTPHWDETFGQYSGSASPVNRKVYYDSSLTGHISFAAVQECVNRWNSAYNLSLQVVSGGSQTANNCLATVVADTIPLETKADAYCSPVICSSSGVPAYYSVEQSENYVDNKWFSTRITLDFDQFTGYTTEEIKGIICHEIGHSLKMSHTYMALKRSGNTYYWNVKETALSLMNGNVISRGTYTPAGIWIDEYRIARKWDGV